MSLRLVYATSVLHSEQENHLNFFTKQVTSTQNTGTRSHQSRAMSRAMEFDQNERQGFPFVASVLCDSGRESLPPHVSIVQP